MGLTHGRRETLLKTPSSWKRFEPKFPTATQFLGWKRRAVHSQITSGYFEYLIEYLMAFIPYKASEWELFYPKKTASVAFSNGSAMDWPASPTGYLSPASSTTTKFAGISQRTSTAADTDYASNTVIACLRPIVPRAQLIALTTGTAVATDVGGRYDLSDDVTVNRAAHAVGRVVMDAFYSATSTLVHFLEPVETGAA